jgi:hypothetical protein
VTANTYEVVTKGRINPSMAKALGEFAVVRVEHGLSHLVGIVPDQAGLHNLLGLLRDMNIPLVSLSSEIG